MVGKTLVEVCGLPDPKIWRWGIRSPAHRDKTAMNGAQLFKV